MAALAAMLAVGPAGSLRAQHEPHDGDPAPDTSRAAISVPLSRMGSGTSWLPDATRMRARHAHALGWDVMLHAAAFLQYVRYSGVRRAAAAGSTSWAMGMASHALAGGTVRLRAHVSAEPFTLERSGYPLLLQSAQVVQGDLVTDRQHPHELFSELALSFERPLGAGLAVALYVAAAGEPAIGPVTYLHRPSAMNDPLAPLGLNAQDAAHTTFGVVTAGLATRRAKLEASVFNGTHGDDARTDLELGSARLDSYGGRLTVNPGARWSVSVSAARVAASRGGAHAHGDEHRISASVLHTRRFAARGEWASALVYGATVPARGRERGAWLLETNLDLDGCNALFGRAEYLVRTPGDLALTGAVSGDLWIGALALGYARELASALGWSAGVGVRATVYPIPSPLDPFYGTAPPVGLLVYARVRPS